MRLRLFLLLVVLVVIIILGAIVILLLTGTFTAGESKNERLLENKLGHTFRKLSEQYGQLSMQTVALSKELSASIESNLREKGLGVNDLQNHPELLEELLAGEYQRCLFSLQSSKSSGVFIILDATVNPNLEDADSSKAGLFIKNMEPNILSSSSPTILQLRGFPDIGRDNFTPLHSQWSMEFYISDAPYFQLPMEAADSQSLPLSRLYYWTPVTILPGTSEEVMLCSAPLVDSKGNVFGVCGFEVSSMLFKLAYMPVNRNYPRLFSMLAPISEEGFDASKALFSGGYSARNILQHSQLLQIDGSGPSFVRYTEEKGNSFLGFHTPVELYPTDSAFFDEKWAVAMMIPEEDIRSSLVSYNRRLSLLFALLMAVAVIISFFLSKYYISPIAKGLDMIKEDGLKEITKTRIPEIDDLIEHLSAQQNVEANVEDDKKFPSKVLNDFLNNIKTLSPAERSVFNFYVQHYTSKEIADRLCLSINTIKTHNRRIYAKLNVSNREELLLLINMLKEAGKEFK